MPAGRKPKGSALRPIIDELKSRNLMRPRQNDAAGPRRPEEFGAVDAIAELLSNEAGSEKARRMRSRALASADTQTSRIRICERLAAKDPSFRALITAADAARDSRDWDQAELLYRQALALYPFYAGYRVQYAHMLKEKRLVADAELQYRSALALAAPLSDIQEHLAFVCARQGEHFHIPSIRGLDAPIASMAHPANVVDIGTLELIFLHRLTLTTLEKLVFLRNGATCREVMLSLVQHESFAARNRGFLELLADTNDVH